MGLWEDLSAGLDKEAPKASLWDELSRGVQAEDHASSLAKHRWELLRAAKASDTFPTTLSPDVAPTNTPYGGEANLAGVLNRSVEPGYGFNPQADEIPTPLPTMPMLTPFGKEEAPPGERFVKNIGVGLVNTPSGLANFFTGIVKNPMATSKGLIQQALAVGKAGLWQMAEQTVPGAGAYLASKGISPDDFYEMFQNDPVTTSAMVLGAAEGLRRGVAPSPKAAKEIRGPGEPIPPPSLPSPEPVYQATHFERSLESLHGLIKEGGTAGRAETRSVQYSAPRGSPKSALVGETASNRSTKSGGTHAIQAVMAEYQLVHPELTWKEVKATFAKDRDAALREIAMARAKDAIDNAAQGFAHEDIPRKLASQTAEGIGSDPTVPINRPLGEFDTARLGQIRAATKLVDEYHRNRVPQDEPRGSEPLIKPKAEQRLPANEARRAAITASVGDIRNHNLDYLAAIDEIARRKQLGEIDGPTESAMLREASKVYSEKIIGQPEPPTGTYSHEAQADMAAFLAENQRLEQARTDQKAGKLTSEPVLAKETVDKVAPIIAADTGEAAVAAGARTEATSNTPAHTLKDMVDTVGSALGDQARANLFNQSQAVETLSKHMNDIIDATVAAKRGGFGLVPALGYVRKVANHIYEHAKGDIASSSFARFQHIAYAKKLVHEVLSKGITSTDKKIRSVELERRLNFFGKIMMDDASRAVDMKNTEIVRLQREWHDAKAVNDPARMKAAKAGLEKLGATEDSVIKKNLLPQLTPAEQIEEMQNPIYSDAVKFHIDNLQVDLETKAAGAGVGSRLYGPRGTYMPLKRYESLSQAPKGIVPVYAPEGGGAPGPMDFAYTKTRAARGRTGAIPEGMFVSMDYMEHAREGRIARYKSFYRRQLQDAIINEDTTFIDGTHPDEVVMPDGKKAKIVKVQILDWRDDKLVAEPWVPKPIADAYHLATHKSWVEDRLLLGKLFQAYTNTALVLMPAEATMHTLNVVSVLAASNKVGSFSKLGTAAQWVPIIGKFATATKRIMMQEGQHLADNMDILAKHGGLRTGSFKQWETTAEAIKMETRGQSWNPKDWLFGYPDHATPALESRLRSALLDVVREGEPGISDADAVRRVNTIAGTYVTKLGPTASKALAPFYPFAKATTALGRTGIQTMIGIDPSTGRLSGKAFLQNVAAPAMAGLLLGKMLDDKHRWNHEIPGAKPLDIVFSRGGTTYHVPARLYMQLVYRGLNVTGLRSAIDQYVSDEGDNAFKRIPSMATLEDVGKAQIRGIGNYSMNLTSPAIKAGEVLLFGAIPYQFPNGDYLNLEHPDMQHPLRARLKAAGTAAFAPIQKLEEKGGNKLATKLGRRINRAASVVGFNIKAEPTSKESAIVASGNKAFQEQIDNALGKIISESRNEDHPQAYMIQEIKKRLPTTGVIMLQGKATPVQVYAIQEGLRRSLPSTHPGLPPAVKENLRLAR